MLFYCCKSNLRQVTGVPMGSDPVPFIGNLFLYYFEIMVPELKEFKSTKSS